VSVAQHYSPKTNGEKILCTLGLSWTVLILEGLKNKQMRHIELKNLQISMPTGTSHKISPKILSDRLYLLEDLGIISREIFSKRPKIAKYRLTKAGEKLCSIIDDVFHI
jgi:DNA-binding HxlR family transcriptional regulator